MADGLQRPDVRGVRLVWTNMGFLLAAPPHGLSEAQIGMFALFGVAGALGARFAGTVADRGHANAAVGAFIAVTVLSFVPIALGTGSLVALAIGLVLFDLGVQGGHISNQSIVYGLRPDARSRLASAYMTAYFLGGALGSGLSALVYAAYGWTGVAVLGAAFPAAALALWTAGTRRSAVRPSAQPASPA